MRQVPASSQSSSKGRGDLWLVYKGMFTSAMLNFFNVILLTWQSLSFYLSVISGRSRGSWQPQWDAVYVVPNREWLCFSETWKTGRCSKESSRDWKTFWWDNGGPVWLPYLLHEKNDVKSLCQVGVSLVVRVRVSSLFIRMVTLWWLCYSCHTTIPFHREWEI